MAVRKQHSGKERLTALGYGVASISVAVLIAQYGDFKWSAAVAFAIGLFGVGGVYRCVAGHDEL